MEKTDLTNKKFGRLTALYPIDEHTKDGQQMWLCLCDCGEYKKVGRRNLLRGNTKSCGCLRREIAKTSIKKLPRSPDAHSKPKDISMKKFGLLTAISPTDKRDGRGCVVWKCKCDCGNIIYVGLSSLTNGDKQSCGCLKSKGEQKILSILQNHDIAFEREKSFPNCVNTQTNNLYWFDFYLPKYNLVIEYDGEQHFSEHGFNIPLEEQKRRDEEKNNYCFNNNINILRIPYTEYDNINYIWLINRIKEITKSL